MVEYKAPNRDEFPWQYSVIRADLTAPPGSPSKGDRYIVAATATGAWIGQENKIAEYTGAAWVFITPVSGWEIWDLNLKERLEYSGTQWIKRVFGNEFQEATDDTESTTTSTTYVQKLRLTTTTLPAGKYRAAFTVELTSTSKGVAASLRVQIDDTTTILEISYDPEQANQWGLFTRFNYLTVSSPASYTVDVDYKIDGPATAKIRNVRIELFRVG